MDYKDIMKVEVEHINKALEDYFDYKIKEVSRLGLIHKQYYENVKEYLMRGGKRLRPLFVVIAYKAIREKVELQHLYRAACSVEILHNGSLLHDDLIDHDETRRGGPTFHSLYREWSKKQLGASGTKAEDFGMTMAILGGDSLINLGAKVITDSNLVPEIAIKCEQYYQRTFEDLIDGVLLEMLMVKDPNTKPETYLEMIKLKTAVLFEKSLLMGAAMANASDSQLEALSEFGVKVGQAFQIQDDILGSFGDESITGKAANGDIREGKKTMLLIEAQRRSTNDQRDILDSLIGKGDMDIEQIESVRSVFQESGALEACKELMYKLLAEGQQALDKAKPKLNPIYKDFLIKLSDFLVKRSY